MNHRAPRAVTDTRGLSHVRDPFGRAARAVTGNGP